MNIIKTRWLAILGLILSLTPVWGFIIEIYQVMPSDLIHSSILILTIAGIILSLLAFVRTHSSKIGTKGEGIPKIGLVIGIFAFVGYGILGTDYIVLRHRDRENQVKQTIHGLQGCIEEYRIKNQGLTPQSVNDFESFIPVSLKGQNPFNSHQIYQTSSGGLTDGIPKDYGIIGYIAPAKPNEPYKFIFLVKSYKDGGKPIPFFIDEKNVQGVLNKADD